MLKQNPALIAGRGMPVAITCGDPAIAIDNANFIANLIAQAVQNPSLPANPPFEVHPYKALLPLQNYEKYIIGTFPPISYVLDDPRITGAGIISLLKPAGGVITPPQFPFYHGNQNSMWPFLLNPFELGALNALPRIQKPRFLVQFLVRNKMNYADIIDTTQRHEYNAADGNLYNICINKDLVCHIIHNPNAKYILFNSASIFGIAGIQHNGGVVNIQENTTKAFDLFVRGCQEIGLSVELRNLSGNAANQFGWTPIAGLIPDQKNNKLMIEIKLTNLRNQVICSLNHGESKELNLITGPFPSNQVAGLGLVGNNILNAWLALPGNAAKNGYDFIRFIYQNSFRNGLWAGLGALNQ